MIKPKSTNIVIGIISVLLSGYAVAQVCTGYGPQTPRDIDSPHGENQRIFSIAPEFAQLNLCNIHMHKNAEHKAKDFSIYAGDGEHGGYQCADTSNLTSAELKEPTVNHCTNIKPGDTIEVHWVYSSCDVQPGKDLGACLSDACQNPDLRVETQVFLVVNDASAQNFNDFDYDNTIRNGYHQAKALPSHTGAPVEFLGSTTGPAYSDQVCSRLQVSWSVRPHCAKVDINSLSEWCKDNPVDEGKDHAKDVRKLVVNPALLSEIR